MINMLWAFQRKEKCWGTWHQGFDFMPMASVSPVCPWSRNILYFFDYKMEFFSFLNNPTDLDPSCKMDLDLWDCLGRVNIGIIATFHRTDLVI